MRALCDPHERGLRHGQPKAEIMFVGEGPGENEDLTGEPFVGRGGKLLDKYLNTIGLDRSKTYT